MEARFAALEKSIFYLMKQIGAPGECGKRPAVGAGRGGRQAALSAPGGQPCLLTPCHRPLTAEPPPTKRRIGYSCGPKGKAAAARAAASNADADTAEVAAVPLAAAPTASQAASRR